MVYPKTRAVLFIRVNRRFVNFSQHAQQAIERQRELGHQVAHRLTATIVREYVDQSGAVLYRNRPALQAMLSSLTSFPVRYVIASDWATLSGNPDQAADLLAAITEAGAELVVGDTTLERDCASEPNEPS